MLTHVPPLVPCPIRATCAPSSAPVIAAENPAEPAPLTARSYRPFGLPLMVQQSVISSPFIGFDCSRAASGHPPPAPHAPDRDAEEQYESREQHIIERSEP